MENSVEVGVMADMDILAPDIRHSVCIVPYYNEHYSVLYAVHCTSYRVRRTVYSTMYCTVLSDLECTTYIVRCILYDVHSTTYDVQCTSYTVRSIRY